MRKAFLACALVAICLINCNKSKTRVVGPLVVSVAQAQSNDSIKGVIQKKEDQFRQLYNELTSQKSMQLIKASDPIGLGQ